MPGMDDAWVRFNRAKSNFDKLHAEVEDFQRDHPSTVRLDQGGKGPVRLDGRNRVRLVASISARPPSDWSLSAGDILVDLRSALDYAVFALAVANCAPDPPPNQRQIEFPIAEDSGWFAKRRKAKIGALSGPAQDWIEGEQPYQPANQGTPDAPAVLLVFNELVGVHKHRFLHVMTTMLKRFSLPLMGTGVRVEQAMTYAVRGELKDGAPLASFRLVATQQHAKVNGEAHLTTNICFEPTIEGSPAQEVTVILGAMCEVVRQYVETMETFL